MASLRWTCAGATSNGRVGKRGVAVEGREKTKACRVVRLAGAPVRYWSTCLPERSHGHFAAYLHTYAHASRKPSELAMPTCGRTCAKLHSPCYYHLSPQLILSCQRDIIGWRCGVSAARHNPSRVAFGGSLDDVSGRWAFHRSLSCRISPGLIKQRERQKDNVFAVANS